MDAFSPDVVFLDAILASVSATGVVARSRLASSLELSRLQMAKSCDLEPPVLSQNTP